MKVVEYQCGVDVFDVGQGLNYYHSSGSPTAQVTFSDVTDLDKTMLEFYYRCGDDFNLCEFTPNHYSNFITPLKVIFSDPATIVLWKDGTKTVVKTQDGEKYDKEKGLAMCYTKKILGNRGRYYDELKKYLGE